ncbi:MAG: hypothetical protein WCX69_01725 [Candidatus Paceibacterota bacterium]
MIQIKYKLFFICFSLFLIAPFFGKAEVGKNSSYFNIDKGCGVAISDADAGSMACGSWQRGSQTALEGIDAASCICANTCLSVPPNHYYFDDPVNKTRQNDENKITLPVVLAWDHVEGWQREDGQYLWHWLGLGGKKAVDSKMKLSGVRSYVLEIDNTEGVLGDARSAGGIFRRVLKTNEFNPNKEFGISCFFNSGRTIKWRVLPCCNDDGSGCMPSDRAEWWEFTASYAPELIVAKDIDWNGPKGSETSTFKGFKLNWCRVFLPESKKYAKSYRLEVASDESGAGTKNCHPLLVSGGQCRADDIFSDPQTGEVVTMYPVQGRQDHALFTRNRTYIWKMKTCFDDNAADCSDFGQSWTFSVKNDSLGVPAAISPKNSVNGEDLAGLPLNLSWSVPDGANSFVYQTSFLDGDQKTAWPAVPNIKTTQEEKNKFDADNLKVDTEYKWRAKACAKFDATDCDDWSEWFLFRTTGRPPKAESMAVTPGIPATFSWEAVAGAKSYNLKITKTGGEDKIIVLDNPETLRDPKYTLGYPDIDQASGYTWKVQTCAHGGGKVCGAWSPGKTFAVPALAAVSNIKPVAGSMIYADQISQNISWSAVEGAGTYRYSLSLLVSNEKQECVQSTIEKNLSRISDLANLNCLGVYQLMIQPCVDSACQSAGPKSEIKFTLDQRVPATKSFFAVCGTSYNNPDTAWNEREACQPKHTVLQMEMILNFIIFRLSFWLLPILVLITGLIFYSPLKTPEIWKKIKIFWQAVGIGYALLFFAWILTGIALNIFGYGGIWWNISI